MQKAEGSKPTAEPPACVERTAYCLLPTAYCLLLSAFPPYRKSQSLLNMA